MFARIFHCCFLLFSIGFSAEAYHKTQNSTLNLKPIIGVLSLPSDGRFSQYYPASSYSYILTPFIKFVQSGGCRVSPIFYDLPQNEILALMKGVNGLVLTAGNSTLWTWNANGTRSPTDLYRTMQFIVKTAIQWNQQGDYYPLWGTQQGMAVVLSVIAEDLEVLDHITLSGRNINLNFIEDGKKSRLYSLFSPDIWHYAQNTSLFWAQSSYGINMAKFKKTPKLNKVLRPLTISVDDKGKEFLTSFEAIDWPIYLVSFDPEINAFDWSNKAYFHSFESIKAAQKISFQFVNNTRLNHHKFPNDTVENRSLIYNYNVTVLPNFAVPINFFPTSQQSIKDELYE